MGSWCSQPQIATPLDADADPSTSKPSSDAHRRQSLRQGLVHEHKHASVYELYEIVKEVGRGMTGKVYEVEHKLTKERYALKCMEFRRIDKELLNDLRNEIALLKLVDHPNVIKLFEFYEDAHNIYLILELCSGGELFERLHEQDGSHYSEAQASKLVRTMCSAIAYCHFQGISHRDLKLENFIFETSDPDAELKLIDFGLSRKYASSDSVRPMHTMVGTPYYIAPEVLLESSKHSGYTRSCDVWSLGVIAYMLLSGTPPFRGKRDREVLEAVRRGKFSMSGSKWQNISDAAKDFVRSLLVFDPSQRPTAEQALKHPWLQQVAAPLPLDPAVISSLRSFGKLSAFKRAAREAVAFSMTARSIRDLRSQFAALDTESRGVVTVQQFCDVLTRQGTPREEALHIFRGIDQAHYECISYSEFLAASLTQRMLLTRERIQEAFQRMDVDGNGFITRQNLQALLGDEWTPEKVEMMMREVDTKGDGRIDFDEFMAVLSQEGLVASDGGSTTGAAVGPSSPLSTSDTGADAVKQQGPSTGGASTAGSGAGEHAQSGCSSMTNSRGSIVSAASNNQIFAARHGGTGTGTPASDPALPAFHSSVALTRRHTGDGVELGTASLFRLGVSMKGDDRADLGGRLNVRLLDEGRQTERVSARAMDTRELIAQPALVAESDISALRTQSDDVAAGLRRPVAPPLFALRGGKGVPTAEAEAGRAERSKVSFSQAPPSAAGSRSPLRILPTAPLMVIEKDLSTRLLEPGGSFPPHSPIVREKT